MGFVLEEKSAFKILKLSFSFKLNWGSYMISIAKTTRKKIWSLYSFYEVFFLMRLFRISINLLYSFAWNTVVMSGLVLLSATWKHYQVTQTDMLD